MADTYGFVTGLNLSSVHPDYEQMISVWNYLEDLYYGSDRWLSLSHNGFKVTSKTNLFLPKHPGEDLNNWESRINQSYYDDSFGKALRRYVDLAFQSGVKLGGDPSSPFRLNYSSISDKGENGCLFFRGVALSALLYGRVYLMVDSVLPSDASQLDMNNNPPYFVKYNPQNVVNWAYKDSRGRDKYSFVLIREYDSVLQSDLSYENIERYRLYLPGACHFYELRKTPEGKSSFYSYAPPIATGLDYIPFYEVGAGYSPDGKNNHPPMRSLADKTRAVYQKQSDHDRKVALCCHPVATLKDTMRSVDEPLVIGANSYVQIQDPNGSFTWQEPLALSLQQSRRDIQDLRSSIALDMAQFLQSPADRQSSAATNLMVSPVEANLESFITAFREGVENAIDAYNDYSGYKYRADNTFELNPDIFPNSNKDAQASFALLNMFNAGAISRRTTLEALDSLGFFHDGFDLESELSRPIAEDNNNAEGKSGIPGQNPGGNSEQSRAKSKSAQYPRGLKRIPKPEL